MEQERRIIWLKWVDPFAHMVRDEKDEDEDNIDFRAARDSFYDDDDQPGPKHGPDRNGTGPAIISPQGVIPIHESNLPSRIFNFWLGHTNFGITREIAKAISRTPGVETLDVFTRYRFRIGVGKAFNQHAVRKAIDDLLRPKPKEEKKETKKPSSPLERTQALLKKKFKAWAIGVMPSGIIEVAGGETVEEVTMKMKRFEPRATRMVLSWELSNDKKDAPSP